MTGIDSELAAELPRLREQSDQPDPIPGIVRPEPPVYDRHGVTVLAGNSLHRLRELDDASVEAVITDPPYGLSEIRAGDVAEAVTAWCTGDRAHIPIRLRAGFMGRSWDRFVPPPALWDECARVLKPGGYLQHRCALPTWEQWLQLRELLGFGDDMDAEVWRLNGRKGAPGDAWEQREVVGQGHRVRRVSDVQIAGLSAGAFDLTAPASDAARQWQGWNTALAPAHEPTILARKPMPGTVAANVQAHGTGALNIAATRVETGERTNHAGGASSLQRVSRVEHGYRDHVTTSVGEASTVTGRWPSNVLLVHAAECGPEEAPGPCAPGCPVAELDQQTGTLTSGANPTRRGADKIRDAYGELRGQAECTPARGADSGGASRFYPTFRYCAKASAAERPKVNGVSWPTVKPLALMRWLVRLVCPPDGLVLDVCAGSGTTGQAARAEGMQALLIDEDPDALRLIVARLDARPPTAASSAPAATVDEPLDLLDLLDGTAS